MKAASLKVLALGLIGGLVMAGCGEETTPRKRDTGAAGTAGGDAGVAGAGGRDGAAGTGGGGTGGVDAPVQRDMAAPVDMGPPRDTAPGPEAPVVDLRPAPDTTDAAIRPMAMPWNNRAIGAGVMPADFVFNSPANENQTIVFGGTSNGFGGTADAVQFFSIGATGDAHVIGQIATYTGGDMAKGMAGVMFRESADADAAMVFIGPTAAGTNGRVVLRAKKGDPAVVVPMDAMMAPAPSIRTGVALRLQRVTMGATTRIHIFAGTRGSVVSKDAAPIGMVTLTLANPLAEGHYGLAFTSGGMMPATLTTNLLQVDNLFADSAMAEMAQFDMGTIGGVALYDTVMKRLAITGWGQEWNGVMGMQPFREILTMVAKPGSGQFSLQAKVDSLTANHPEARAGILYRAQVHASGGANIETFSFSRSGGGLSVSMTPTKGILFEGRTMGYQEVKWDSKGMTAATIKAPYYIRLDKVLVPIPNDPLGGSRVAVAAYTGEPGPGGIKPMTWNQLGPAQALDSVASSAIGFHVSSYNPIGFATLVLSDITWGMPMQVTLPPPSTDAGTDSATASPDAAPDAALLPDAVATPDVLSDI